MVLKITGAVLDKNQAYEYMSKIASEHIIKNTSDKDTFPLKRLKDNFEYITKTYNLLNKHISLGIESHPAGEWLLDNYYIIEESVKSISKELNLKKYRKFPGISNGQYKGFARIYVIACEIVAHTDNKVNYENLELFLRAYQSKKNLEMDEIWNISLFLQIAIIENIREICETVYSVEIQKYRVENIFERLVESKEKKDQKFKENTSFIKITGARYPFIEYMAYKLKKYGKETAEFLEVLELEVNKMGTTITEVIRKEHFDIALKKISIGNAIMSIKNIQRINFLEIFESINGVEEILKKDPVNVYEKMDYKTKNNYREIIKKISKKTKISEIYIANKILELANNEYKKQEKEILSEKKSHIGYYLLDGKNILMQSLTNKKYIKIESKTKLKIYSATIIIFTIMISGILSILCFNPYKRSLVFAFTFLILLIPCSEIVIQILNYILGKIVKPKLVPKLNFEDGIPKEYATFVVIPTIISKEDKIKNLIQKLEVYYLANKSENIYFALLGDCTSSKNEKEINDEKVIKIGLEEINKMNKKYEDGNFAKFHFLYRKRTWNSSEKMYLGWERKRGLLNQFNEFLLRGENPFLENTIDREKMPKIRYIITLDSDTDLTLNSGLEVIGAMAHILNRPILDKNKQIVIDGYGIMQPRVGISLKESKRSLFTKIYAGAGGTDSYTNAISDIYFDNFGEGIFTGKGIYDLETFSKILYNEIPENTVLSHDLLEGNYLRCGLLTDVLLMDGYPYKYNAFMARLSRWIRGDWQIGYWLKRKIKNKELKEKENPLNLLSKFKMFDNLRRSLIEISAIIGIFYLCILKLFNMRTLKLLVPILISIIIGNLIQILDYIIYRKDGQKKQKAFSQIFSKPKGEIIKLMLELSFLPYKAYISLNAICKSIYRMKVSKSNLLEWTTSEEAEKASKTDIKSYILLMKINIVLGLLLIGYTYLYKNLFLLIYGIALCIAPIIAWGISQEIINKKEVEKLNSDDKKYILKIAEETWKYFNEYMNKENNFLPPDNYQENRKQKIVFRTSSTNIGLGLLSIISAYDLKFIKKEEAIDLIEKVINTIERLTKWRGHLYNWYNTKTLEPLSARFISTVDSGNFVGYLYIVKQFLLENNFDLELVNKINNIIEDTDFFALYDKKKRLFSIGYDIENDSLVDSYYDLLASEARQASIIAIAKKDVPVRHWNSLSRTLTVLKKYKGLVSWSGTAFEYLMPNINIPKYEGSLLDESCKFMIMSQKEYCKKLDIPWGISESALNLKDLNSNYQYKAFGIPWLGLKRGLSDEIVVSSYGSVLAINDNAKDVISNLKRLESYGMHDKYGFYESIDFTPTRLNKDETFAVVKTYMAHHQALILLSINNLINNDILQERFMKNPEIKSVEILLQERMPENVIIKEKKEKPKIIKYKDFMAYTERIFENLPDRLNDVNVISNGSYTIVVNKNGEGYSKYNDILINRFKETEDFSQGIYFYIKNVKNKKVYIANGLEYLQKPSKYEVHFTPDKDKFIRIDGNIETTTEIIAVPEKAVEIRRLEIKNNGNTDELVEVTSVLEPVLSCVEQDYAHKAFNNLFLKFEFDDKTNTIIIKRNKRGNTKDIYMGINLFSENNIIGDIEYEIDKEKLYGRGNISIPQMIKNSTPLSKKIGLTTDPIVAIKNTLNILANKTAVINLIITISENKQDINKNIEHFLNSENIQRSFDLSQAKVYEESRYLGITGKQIELYQKMIGYLIFQNPMKKLYINKLPKKSYSQTDLWKHGISGDVPILLVKIKDVNDAYIIYETLKCYEYFRVKNIKFDLVFLIKENDIYISNMINKSILDSGQQYLINSGIFILNENEIKIKDLLEFRSNLILNAADGNLEKSIKNMENQYLKHIKEIKLSNNQTIINPEENLNIDMQNLKYYNEYGGFSEDGKEYMIKINKNNKLPSVWCNIMANDKFGSIVTEGMSGFSWRQNSRLNRLTAWSNNNVFDNSAEVIYLKDKETGNKWSMGANPMPDDNNYYITYGFGYSFYKHLSFGILQEAQVFVSKDDEIKINIISLKNTKPTKRFLKLLYYIKPVLGEDEIKSNGYIDIRLNKEKNVLEFENLYNSDFLDNIGFINSSEKIISYTGNKKAFLGNGNLENPIALDAECLDNENSLGQDGCIAIELEIILEPFERKEFVLNLGLTAKEKVQKIIEKYDNVDKALRELRVVKEHWMEIINNVQVKVPLESANIMLNGWLVYQTIVSRLLAKSAFYQSGGAIRI